MVNSISKKIFSFTPEPSLLNGSHMGRQMRTCKCINKVFQNFVTIAFEILRPFVPKGNKSNDRDKTCKKLVD